MTRTPKPSDSSTTSPSMFSLRAATDCDWNCTIRTSAYEAPRRRAVSRARRATSRMGGAHFRSREQGTGTRNKGSLALEESGGDRSLISSLWRCSDAVVGKSANVCPLAPAGDARQQQRDDRGWPNPGTRPITKDHREDQEHDAGSS